MRIETGILLGLPGMAKRARQIRRVHTRAIAVLKRDDPGIEGRYGSHEHWELTISREVLRSVAWVLFGDKKSKP
jgi:hypothetical protein